VYKRGCKRLADHDQLSIDNLEINDDESVGASTIGVSFVRRMSNALDMGGHEDGITPPVAAKVIFTSKGISQRLNRQRVAPCGSAVVTPKTV
jgi:hypothetical protein